MADYQPENIESKWQEFWRRERLFAAAVDPTRPKFYCLDMFPYPSGEGLHVGHPEGYTATDILSRYKRARGFNVLHPMGWDAFGLPAEQYAIKTNTHPRIVTQQNVERFRRQLQALGFSYDWDRQINTTDPAYYRWTQWIFLKLYHAWFDESAQKARPIGELIADFAAGRRLVPGGQRWADLAPAEQRRVLANFRLAYEQEAPVNWCPALGTVLANEEVIDGKSEVGGFPVERRRMRQWMLRITAYAERLLNDLDALQWPESLKMMQRNWIGRSEGAQVDFQLAGGGKITVFTTRPDTLFGATYMVLAPEHPLVDLARADHVVPSAWPAATRPEWKADPVAPDPRHAVAAYQRQAAARTERQRQEDTGKTGVFTGAYAVNPVNHEAIPIFVSDYVLMGYGTGAIMAVPAHDSRDFQFARRFKLPIRRVVSASSTKPQAGELPWEADGFSVASPGIEGLATAAAKSRICAWLEQHGHGCRRINYKIHDWLFSRQRYWGEPFPLVHLEDATTVALVEEQLPLELPPLEDFKPTGAMTPPLDRAAAWRNVAVLLEGDPANPQARVVPPGTPGAVPARREANTMPQWAGSCWYYLRFLDPHNDRAFCDPKTERYWMTHPDGVDLYIGGVEHAVLHLLYARFWHKVLFDWGLVSSAEPFHKLVNQGLILGEDDRKMSKSRGNVVNPDAVIAQYGADSLRLFEMFMGPLEQVKPWSTKGVEGVHRFLQRLWRNLAADDPKARVVWLNHGAWFTNRGRLDVGPARAAEAAAAALRRPLHRTIRKVTQDIEKLSFNTAISAMMEFNNLLTKSDWIPSDMARTLLRLLEPFAPHIAEELYQKLSAVPGERAASGPGPAGPPASLTRMPWPDYDEALCIDEVLEIPVQINGKLSGRVKVAAEAPPEQVLQAALADAQVQARLANRPLRKHVYIPGRMLNLVV